MGKLKGQPTLGEGVSVVRYKGEPQGITWTFEPDPIPEGWTRCGTLVTGEAWIRPMCGWRGNKARKTLAEMVAAK